MYFWAAVKELCYHIIWVYRKQQGFSMIVTSSKFFKSNPVFTVYLLHPNEEREAVVFIGMAARNLPRVGSLRLRV